MRFVGDYKVIDPDTFMVKVVRVMKKFQIERPDWWVGETWVPSWMTLAAKPGLQLEFDLESEKV